MKRFLDEVIAITGAFLKFLDAVIFSLIEDNLKKARTETDVSRTDDPSLPAFPEVSELAIGDVVSVRPNG